MCEIVCNDCMRLIVKVVKNRKTGKMSAAPQAAFMVRKYREMDQKPSEEYVPFSTDHMALNPVKYNSKMMNSIWGLYNRYSVHNLKDSLDKNTFVDAVVQQKQSVAGTASSGSKSVFGSLNVLDKLQSVLGYPH
ncbi:hypothetical protein FQA39_LY04334 [Lamprigera yunnana]|nr:hypothetical protein FQA39_LY04334 [Lamprigera yunnana]